MSTAPSRFVSSVHGSYYEACLRGNLFVAQAIVTAPVIYTTAAGTGGPLIWNGSGRTPGATVNVNVLAIGWGVTTVTTVAAALGWTGGTEQTAAPTTTTAIDGGRNLFLGGAASRATAYRIGTVTNAGNFLMPFGDLHTGALTTTAGRMQWVNVDGLCMIPPDCWGSVSVSATATTTVMQIAVVWEEIAV